MKEKRTDPLASRRFGEIGPGYLILGFVYVLGLSGLAITAAKPDLTDLGGGSHWLISWAVAPGAWYTGLGVTVLAIVLAYRVNAISPTPPGRFDPWMAGFLILSSMVLSFTSYAACQSGFVPDPTQNFDPNGPFDSWLKPLIDSISIFAFSYHDPFVTDLNHCSYYPPLALTTSALIAVVAVFSAVVAVLISLSDRLRDLLTIRRSAVAQVAIGIDPDSADFLASVARESSGDSLEELGTLVVLTRLPDLPEVDRLRAEGAVVIRADTENVDTIRDLFRRTEIRRLYLLSSDASSNVHRFNELAERVGDKAPAVSVLRNAWSAISAAWYRLDDFLAGTPRARKPRIRYDTEFTINSAVVRIDNVWDAQEWRAREIKRDMVDVSVVGLYENTAQALIRPFRHPESDVLGLKYNHVDPVTEKTLAIWEEGTTGDSTMPRMPAPTGESSRHFVICGSSQLTLGLLSALSRSAYEEDQLRAALHLYEGTRITSVLEQAKGALTSPGDGSATARLRAEVEELESRLREHNAVPARSPGRVTVHLIAPDASAIRTSFYERASRRRKLSTPGARSNPLTIEATNSDPHVARIQEALRSIGTDEASRTVVIITDDTTHQFGLLGTMVADLPENPKAVFEHSEGVWSSVTGNPTGHLQYGLNLGAPMGNPGEATRAIESLDDARAIAELSHTEYLLMWVSVTVAAEESRHRRGAENFWARLDRFYKVDNERPVRTALRTLRDLRRQIDDANSDDSGAALAALTTNFLTTRPEEKAALTSWRKKPVNDSDFLDFAGMLREHAGRIGDREITEEQARDIFIILAKAEHSSWMKGRADADPPWGFATTSGDQTPRIPDAEHWKSRAEQFGEVIGPDSATKHARNKALEAQRLSPEILEWDELIAADEKKHTKATPDKVFSQVRSVLHHLDALGYISVILGRTET